MAEALTPTLKVNVCVTDGGGAHKEQPDEVNIQSSSTPHQTPTFESTLAVGPRTL